MKVYTVYAPPETGRNPVETAIGTAFIKDGFCWPALFIPPIWLLWHRMWLVLLGWLLVVAAFIFVNLRIELIEALAVPVAFLLALWFAFEANGFRRWTLRRHGWRNVGIVTGRDRVEAEYSFFARWVDTMPQTRPTTRKAAVPAAPRRPADEEPVIGLFPKPE